MLTDGPEAPRDSELVYHHIGQIVHATLLLHELFLVRIAGEAMMEPLIDDWLTQHAAVPVDPVAERRALLLPYLAYACGPAPT